MHLAFSAASTLLFGICAQAFYLPGAAPHDYVLGDQVNVLVNALTPMAAGKDDAKLVGYYKFTIFLTNNTSLGQKSMINCELFQRLLCSSPRCLTLPSQDDYYNPNFRFCEPLLGPVTEPEHLGSILFGDRIFSSPYDVRHTYLFLHSFYHPTPDPNAER